ncbi:Zn-dependent exopeptidase M28 [Rhizobium leguminosarum]|uniref:Zn-dependent exopeptidase M28 n=1 Tax=Rhizobium leguminosarum TaxID=384 RepID=UPI001C91CD40|nr:Zn-dependent exopeptidase M28 [Rhizobium leguminosarum]MBY2988284.1 Zn-dependent exopeptidase M28 [Rhizobium leguminosarum]
MDMIGTLNTAADRSASGARLGGHADAGSRYPGPSVEILINAANSDHVPFLDKGIPAALTIGGADCRNEIQTSRGTPNRVSFDPSWKYYE